MSKEIEEYKKSDWLSVEEKSVIDRQFFPHGASVDDKRYCMKVAETFNLNPILKQIYFVPRKTNVNGQWIEKVEPLAGRDSFLTLAHRTGKFDGIESKVEIKDTPVLKEGKWTRENDLVATAIVYKKGCERPFIVSVNYREYVQKTKAGDITQFWKDKPETMLKKVAESQVLRKAFDITGLYAEEEYEERYINSDRKAENVSLKHSNSSDSLENLLSDNTSKDNAIEVDFIPVKSNTITQKQKLINQLMDRGSTVEEAGKWCYGKNEDVFNSYLNDPASIDSILEEMRGF